MTLFRIMLALCATAGMSPSRARETPAAPATIDALHAELHHHRCVQMIKGYLDRIAADQRSVKPINAYILVAPDALAQARQRDRQAARGPLFCVPVAIKDNIDVSGLPTTGGSRLMRNNFAAADAPVVARLRAAGAIILGKANMDEWAHAGAVGGGYSAMGGQTRNVHDRDRSPSGSSGGPGAAVAAGLALIGVGSDTSGSLRGPAAALGLVTVKSTVGLVPTAGVIPFSSTTDVVGPLAATVADAARALDALTASDGLYARAVRQPSLKGRRIGVIRSFYGGNGEIDANTDRAIAVLRERGAVIVEGLTFDPGLLDIQMDIHLPVVETEFRTAIEAYLRARGGSVASLADLVAGSAAPGSETVPGVTDYLRKALAMATSDPSYRIAHTAMSRLYRAEIDRLLNAHTLDALVFQGATCPARPYEGSPATVSCQPVPSPHYMASNSGYPQVSVPSGTTREGLPTSLAFLGTASSEALLLAIAAGYHD